MLFRSISVEEDKKEIDKRYLNYKTIEKKLSFFELKKEINERFFKNELSIEERKKIKNKFLLNSLFEYVKENSEKNLKILLFNDNNFFVYNNIILVHIIEQILMKNYNKKSCWESSLEIAETFVWCRCEITGASRHGYHMIEIGRASCRERV